MARVADEAGNSPQVIRTNYLKWMRPSAAAEWFGIPAGISLASARQIMEQHQFACTVGSYDSKVAMPPGSDAIRWDTGIIRDGKPAALTNLTLLTCSRSETNEGDWVYEATLTVLNGKTDSHLTVSSRRIK